MLSEHQEQINIIRWVRSALAVRPSLRLLYAVPNGGKRDKKTATKLKAEGVKKGVSDLVLPVPIGIYAGLYLELKTMKGTATQDQKDWLDLSAAYGHLALCVRGHVAAIAVIEQYLSGGAVDCSASDIVYSGGFDDDDIGYSV